MLCRVPNSLVPRSPNSSLFRSTLSLQGVLGGLGVILDKLPAYALSMVSRIFFLCTICMWSCTVTLFSGRQSDPSHFFFAVSLVCVFMCFFGLFLYLCTAAENLPGGGDVHPQCCAQFGAITSWHQLDGLGSVLHAVQT